MKRFFGFLAKRWVITLLGILLIAALIWFAGPYIAIAGYTPLASALPRVIAILVVLLLWLLNVLRKQMMARRADKELVQGIVASEPEPVVQESSAEVESAEEVALLKDHFEEAASVLGKAGRKRGARSLYELPWYILIGPPGCGKTTILKNSGLEFPLAERFGKEALRGVGGTRNCDWWITDEAVLLDTAGRYTTQDSDAAVDSAAWEGFLGLLKKYRRRRPINGAMIAISLSDLMLQSEHERGLHIRAIKKRLQELHQQLGVRFPVYIMFTKCDLIAGFMEFFEDLGREERVQVWGMTFPFEDDAQASATHFDKEFEYLLERINSRLLWRLNQERDLARRSLIYGFPQQLASLKEVINGFLVELFQSSRFEQQQLLRGFYFTSGTQEGTPIDRLMGSLARTFGLGRQEIATFGGQGRSYFVTNLLKEVIFKEQDLVGLNRKFEKRRAWMQKGAYAGAIGAAVLGALGWTTSYTYNNAYLEKIGSGVEEYSEMTRESVTASSDFDEIVPRLDAMGAITGGAKAYQDDIPLKMRLGLYQGKGIGDAAHDAYRRELNLLLVPGIALHLEAQLKAGVDDSEFMYEALKVYLMLRDTARLDPELVKQWMEFEWEKRYPGDPNMRGRLEGHLSYLLESGLKPVELDPALVADVRAQLKQVPLAELAYTQMKQESMANDTMPFRVSAAAGRDADKVFVRASGASLDDPIPGLFTQKGFYQVFQKAILKLVSRLRKESWVLGSEESDLTKREMVELEKGVRNLYFDDYIRLWDKLLKDLEIVPFRNLRHASEVADLLAAPASPMVRLLKSVERNTTLTRLSESSGKLAELAGEAAARKSRLARIVRRTEQAGAFEGAKLPGHEVDSHFERLNELVRGAQGSSRPIDRITDQISELYGYLSLISGSGDGALDAIKGGESARILQRLKVTASQQPEPVKTWLLQLGGSSRGVTAGGARAQLNAIWKSEVLPKCREALTSRYPFNKGSREEATLKDFGRFFAPGGVLDSFFNAHLKNFVDTSSTPWRQKRGSSLGISSRVLTQFQRATRIRDSFFQGSGQLPAVEFTLKPISLSANVSKFLLDLEGQNFVYRHGPTMARNAQWPGSGGANRVRLVFEEPNKDPLSVTKDGPWAWFRLLDESNLEAISSNRLIANFELGGRQAKYEIRANSVYNPFLLKELHLFRCPGNL